MVEINLKKLAVVMVIVLITATVHVLRLGQVFSGTAYNLYYSFFSDLVLPFTFYFLLTLNEAYFRILRRWYVKAGAIFALATTAEICQGIGIEVLGETFDPLDIACYAAGVLAAAVVDRKVFPFFFGYWKTTEARPTDD